MCPACLATLAYILAGAGSAGGLLFLGLKGGVKSRHKPAGPPPAAPRLYQARPASMRRPSLW